MLYFVATPIGNLSEATYRAIEILNKVDYIACEDTRTSKVFLDHYNISKKLISYHKFNENTIANKIITDLKNGSEVAIISDAGMPGISDPGNILVNLAISNNIEYTVISGPCALINAFVLSGYSAPFTFIGFLPDKKRNEFIQKLKVNIGQLIIYMSPHSIINDINDLYSILGDREICIIREISKKFEEKTFSTLKNNYTGTLKGEFVVIIKAKEKNSNDIDILTELKNLIDLGYTKNEAIKEICKNYNLPKNEVYKHSIGL